MNEWMDERMNGWMDGWMDGSLLDCAQQWEEEDAIAIDCLFVVFEAAWIHFELYHKEHNKQG